MSPQKREYLHFCPFFLQYIQNVQVQSWIKTSGKPPEVLNFIPKTSNVAALGGKHYSSVNPVKFMTVISVIPRSAFQFSDCFQRIISQAESNLQSGFSDK